MSDAVLIQDPDIKIISEALLRLMIKSKLPNMVVTTEVVTQSGKKYRLQCQIFPQ